jgi:leucyl/phenylalanyl-tRNA--protein transferase
MAQNQETAPYWIDPDSPEIYFPDVELALLEPDGLLAVGGDLSSERLLYAYRNGIFPWYGPDQPILWWSPDPRLVLFPEELRISRSLARTLRKKRFSITLDTAFEQVINECAAPRPGQAGTWITAEMQAAYTRMHELGHAHSVECWYEGELVGGLYGLALGRVFFGESMFTRIADASKVGFVSLVRQLQHWGFRLIDCQVYTEHLESLGATSIPRRDFVSLLKQASWQADIGRWELDNMDW